LSDVIFFIPVALITEGSIFIASGLLEIKDRKLDERMDSLPEKPGGLLYTTKTADLKHLWSPWKKTIIISVGVLVVLASTATIDLVRYNQRITRASMLAVFYFNRGLAYAGKGDFANAVTEYYKAIQLEPRYTEAYYNRGLAYLYSVNSNISDAIDDFDRVIQLDPNYAMAYYYRGIIHVVGDNIALNYRSFITYNRDHAKNAISDISKYLQFNPVDAKAYNFRGLAYFNISDLDNAIGDFDHAIQLNPAFAIAYNNRGLAYASKGNLDRAISDYDEALHLQADFSAAYYNRGQAFYDKGDLDLAISDWEQAIWIKPDTSRFFKRGYIYYDKFEIIYNLGLTYYDKGDLDLAINEFDQVIQGSPGILLSWVGLL
jgi:tetratricopeptide (TPR) repeat protein